MGVGNAEALDSAAAFLSVVKEGGGGGSVLAAPSPIDFISSYSFAASALSACAYSGCGGGGSGTVPGFRTLPRNG